MKKLLPARIAWRYLRAKKSHSAVGAISIVSICGVAVATAAIICVLSVFNGFKSVIAERIDTLAPDVMVTPASGKVIANADSLAAELLQIPGVETAMPSILDNALVIYNGQEAPVSLKGVDTAAYNKITSLPSLLLKDLPAPPPAADDDPPAATISIGMASRLGAYPGDRLLLFTPRREGRVNLANPAASFIQDSVGVTGIYQAYQSEYDDNRIIVDIDLARDLFQYGSEASAIEVKAAPGVSSSALAEEIARTAGPEYIAKDRLRQQEMNFRMISIEKWVSFLLLFFILLIASFNIISSLSMLVLEKQKSMGTLAALGMSRRSIGAIFSWESVFVSLVGGLSGIAGGLILCLLQQHFGFIKIQGEPDSLIVTAYPVVVKAWDILATLIPILIIGLITSLITDAFARSRLNQVKG